MRFTAWRFNLPRPPNIPPPPPPPGAPPNIPPPPPGPPKPPAPPCPPPGPPPPGPPRPPPGPCPPSPLGLPGTKPFAPNPPGPFPERPWPTVPCNKNESEVALEPAPAGSSAAIRVPSFAGVLVAPVAPPAPSSVRSVCSNPPPARPARIALVTPAGAWPLPPPAPPLRPPPAFPPAFAFEFAVSPDARGLRGARVASGFADSSATVATRNTIGIGPGGATGISTTSEAFANPSWLASTRYDPAGICGNSNLPDSSVQLSHALFVSVFTRRTVAAGTGVPSGVRTNPLTICGGLAGCCAQFKFPPPSQNSSSANIFAWWRLKMTFPRADQLLRSAGDAATLHPSAQVPAPATRSRPSPQSPQSAPSPFHRQASRVMGIPRL